LLKVIVAERIAKSLQATRDFHRLIQLDKNTDESHGASCPPIKGTLAFNDVCFTYPERPEAQILKNTSLKIADGEFVAIVGASGSGKSTIGSLLLRLYQPTSGSLTIGSHDVSSIDVDYLRNHVAVVTQTANLFDASIAENISYGTKDMSFDDIQRAAVAANVHDFIMSLPDGYDTMVGENASLISGGQAQRIQIARALARPSKILILDECTSALDPKNQAVVLDTIRRARVGRTTLMITHKLPAMKMCDRILVVSAGSIVEEGSYEELMANQGVFAQLARAGEWIGL
jgi:ATP-binding cassette, subfamily B (MDR/TAP), member 1